MGGILFYLYMPQKNLKKNIFIRQPFLLFMRIYN